MLRQENRYSFRFKLAIVAVVVLISGLSVLAVNSRALFSRAANMQDRQPVAVPVPLPVVLVPAGLPVALSNSTATTESGGDNKPQLVSSINFRAASLNAEQLISLNLAVLEFDQQGALRRVDGFVRRVDLSGGRTQAITLPLDHSVRIGHRLALTVERADSTSRRWEASFNDLARGIAIVLAGSPTANVSAINEPPAPPENGAALCASGSRRALALAAAGDQSGITSYTCNQQQRSFQFTFNGKALLQ